MSEVDRIKAQFEALGIITATDKAYVRSEFNRLWAQVQPFVICLMHWRKVIWLQAFYALPAPERVLLLPERTQYAD